MNSATIVGRLGRDPELKSLPSGKQICTFSLATSERYKDKEGNKQEKTEWHNITVFAESLAPIVAKYSKKGDMLLVQGKLKTRTYEDKNGSKQYRTEIIVDFGGTVEFLTPKGSSGSNAGSDDGDFSGGDLPDDDIPF